MSIFPLKEKITVHGDGVIEVEDTEILGTILNRLGEDNMIDKLYVKETSIQELFDRIIRKEL